MVIDVDGDNFVRDIPVGPYRLQAVLIAADGSRQRVLLSNTEYADTPIETYNLDWVPDGNCNLGNGWKWTDLYLWLP